MYRTVLTVNRNYFYAFFDISFREYRSFLKEDISYCNEYNTIKFIIQAAKAFFENFYQYEKGNP